MQIGFLIFPGFPMACLTSMIEPLRAANEIVGKDTFGWKLVSEKGARVEASAKVWFEPDLSLDQTDDLDQLFLLSGPSTQFKTPATSDGKLRKLARHGMVMGAISGGVFPLARAGLLEGHTTSVHWCYAAAFNAEFPDLVATDDVIAMDGRRVTASGAAAAFDLSLHLIEKALGAEIATEVACWFQHPLVRGQGVIQRKPTVNSESTADMLPPIVRDAVEMFASHIEDPINVADVANAIGVSVRQVERMFKKDHWVQSVPLLSRDADAGGAAVGFVFQRHDDADCACCRVCLGHANDPELRRGVRRPSHNRPREDQHLSGP